ncbi:MAG: ROK family protein, partial [Actinobacteria bacterium]|nr:ROK family protein [Actinomycetota bacterium]
MVPLSAATQDEVRRNNLSRILRRLHVRGPASRSDLVALTGLNRSTVGILVAELAEAGLVVEQAGATGSVGRPSLVVAPVPDSAVVFAFDFRVERLVGAVVGFGGTVLARADQRHRRSAPKPQAGIKQIVSMTHELLAGVPEGARWVGTGVGVPGIVDLGDGLVRLAPNLNWIEVPLGPLVTAAMSEEFGHAPSTVIGNDADLGAIAENVRGAAGASRNVIYLSGEVGIGGGVVIDGRLMSGAGGYGGEVGHMVINPRGDMCRCGSRGCWETLIGRDAIVHDAGISAESGEVADVVRLAEEGDEKANEALGHAGDWLGIGIGNLVNIFNPEVVVLGGHLGDLLPHVSGVLLDKVGHSIKASRDQVTVVTPKLGRDSTV